MSTRTVVVTVLGIVLFAPAAFAGQPGTSKSRVASINAREQRQVARIKDGVEDKQLTAGELDKLKASEAGVKAEERVFEKSGNGLNKAEYKDLEKDLNQTSKEIYRLKHNNRVPGSGGGK